MPEAADNVGVSHQEFSPPLIAWVGLAILVLLAFVSFLDRQIIALLISPIERDLHIGDTQIGFLQGPAFGLVYPIFAIPLGYAADRYSRQWVIFWGVMFWSLSAMFSGLAHSFGVLFAARVGVGLGEAALGPATASLLSDMFPRHRLATVFSVYSSGAILGQAGALAIGGAVVGWAKLGMDVPLLGHLAAWQIAFILTGMPAAVLAWLIFIVPEPKRDFRSTSPARLVPPRWSEVFDFVRQTWAYLVCYTVGQSLLIMVGAGAWSWLPAAMERSFGWTMGRIGSAVGLFTVAFGLTGQLANGIAVDRMFSQRDDAHLRYYVFAAVVVTLSGCLAPLVPNPWIYLAILGPMKFLMNFGGVFTAALQVVTPSRLRGRLTALTGLVTGLVGWTLGPSIVAFLTDDLFHDRSKAIWSIALMTGIFIPIAGVVFALGLRPMRDAVCRQRAADDVALAGLAGATR